MSATIAIGFSQIRANTSNESGVRQGPLYTALFKLGPTSFAVALKTIRSFVKLWSFYPGAFTTAVLLSDSLSLDF